MNTQTDFPNAVAKTAAKYRENLSHQEVIDLLNTISGKSESYYEFNGYVDTWSINNIPAEKAIEIVKRGRNDEILYMIERLKQAICPKEKMSFLQKERSTLVPSFPDEARILLLKRGNIHEVHSLMEFAEFGPEAQIKLVKNGTYDDVIFYIQRYPLCPEAQKVLLERGNFGEINFHRRRHGFCAEITNRYLKNMQETGNTTEYYDYINCHEFSVPSQIEMLKTVQSSEFYAYIQKYGLWDDAHATLVENRTEDEVVTYIRRHKHLSDKGCEALANSEMHQAKMYYVRERFHQDNFILLHHLLRAPKLDYEAIGEMLLQKDKSCKWSIKEDTEIVRKGSYKEILALIEEHPLDDHSLLMLFLRNDDELFEAYLNRHIRNRS